jgi:hypothetical protein
MEFTTASPAEINWSYRKGEITTTLGNLRKIFGDPCMEEPTQWDKIGYEWRLKFADGTISTIYDWKRYTDEPLGEDEVFTFNIGGFNSNSVLRVNERVLAALPIV